MTGSVKWNLVFAIFGFIFTFLLSLTANVWQTSIIRGAIGFFAFFILAFLFRAVWSLIRSAPAVNEKQAEKETGINNSFDQQPAIDETSAEQTSEMIRSLLKDDDNKRNMNE